jgi:hypothetical protein
MRMAVVPVTGVIHSTINMLLKMLIVYKIKKKEFEY